MNTKNVRDLMVPLSEYATVSEDATLSDAVKALHNAQLRCKKDQYRHRAVLAYDNNKKITGKLSATDIIRSVEPKYRQFQEPDQKLKTNLSRFGLSSEFLSSMVKKYYLWEEDFDVMIKKAAKQKVKDIMDKPAKDEFVTENSSLAEAVHMLVIGNHQSLLVLKDHEIVGVLKLTDIFKNMCDRILES
ncbi:MAG: CBS domain-containing protein [Desulfobacteraceae bacterium]